MKRRWLPVALLAVVAGCASIPRSFEVSQEQIEAALAKRFPYETRTGDVLRLKLDVPRVLLLPEANRLRLLVALHASERISGRSVEGNAALSFALRYEPSDTSLHLANVRVENIELRGLPDAWRRPAELAGTMAAEQLLEGSVLHRFRPDQIERAQGWTPGDIRVTSTGVRVDLRPPAP